MFSVRLRQERNKIGISQRELSKQLFISQQAYARYETGAATPNPEMLSKISKILGVPSDYLIGLTDDPSPRKANAPTEQTEDAHTRAEWEEKLNSLSDESLLALLRYLDFLVATQDAPKDPPASKKEER